MTRVLLRIGPNPKRAARIGIAEQFPGGAGHSWRASVWIAARSAAQAVGREIVDFRFLADSEGFIDGPSAGGLFTAGFMAALTGARVRPEVSMTGTVNPDGTVGVVGGLEQKLLAAIQRGKKVLGYPEGNKLTKGKGGRVVNLETLAAEHGAKAVPVRDIYEAYRLLTGKAFPKRGKASPQALQLDKPVTVKLLGKAADWRKQHQRFRQLGEENLHSKLARRFYGKRFKPAKIYLDASLAAAKAEHPGAAYYSAVRSATWAYTAQKFTDVVYLWKKWITLVKKEQRSARGKFLRLLKRRIAEKKRQALEKQCKKERYKSARCKRLRTELAKARKAARREARLERRRKARAKRRAKRRGKRTTKAGKGTGRAAKDNQKDKDGEESKVPPEPPRDFQKLLIDKARDMDEKTKAIDRVKADLALKKPKTVDQALALISGYAELVQGAAFAIVGKTRLKLLQRYKRFRKYMRNARMKRRMAVKTVTYVDDTVKFAGIAFGKAKLARELSEIHSSGGQPVSLTETRMQSIANQLFAAAKANLDFINSLLPRGFRGLLVRRYLSSRSPEYVIARLGMSRAGKLVFKFREAGEQGKHIELGTGYAALGAAVASYLASSKLIAKVFTLGIRHKTGQVIRKVKRPVELTNALHRARSTALEAAYRAQKRAGIVPTYSRILYETANQYRKESLSGQVKALELYWRATLYSRLAEMLIRQ